MTPSAIGLVLVAAVLHATWNLLSKRARGNAAFTWLCDIFTLILFAPVVFLFILLFHITMTLEVYGFIVVSGLLELAYFLLLQRGYRVGDLSLVYPVTRGTGPLLTTVLALLVLGEHPTTIALCGTACVVIGVLFLAWKPRNFKNRMARMALLYGVLTGCCIAGYTLWDKVALTDGHLAPLILYYGTVCLRFPVLTPFALSHWPDVRFFWRAHRLKALGIAIMSTFSYVLVLIALTFTPATYIAPFREVSVLFGTLLGSYLLKEGEVRRRLVASIIIVAGIVLLAL